MSQRTSIHIPVLADEVVQWLNPQPGQTIVDGTLGGGGHTRLLAERVGDSGRVIALDRDPAALARAERELAGLPVMVSQSNFCDLPEVLRAVGIEVVDGILLDLGVSSDQLADRERGFSFDSDAPLDLRFDSSRGEPAWRLLEKLREKSLADLIYQLGEERRSRRIAREIVARRKSQPVRTARDLANLVRQCVPQTPSRDRIHPATRTFQALRIAVNDELKSLEIALTRLPDRLREGGRLAIISFHSLEDRRVKEAFRDDPRLHALTRKPIRPGEEEIDKNPRSRSAKMRLAERTTIDHVPTSPLSHSSSGKNLPQPLLGKEGSHGIQRIVSGGQTGVDRAALDVALELSIPCGGWCPQGRRAEDGEIPDRYPMQQTASPEYRVRTEKNVLDSDGTLILHRGDISGGTELTEKLAAKHERPRLLVELPDATNIDHVRRWLRDRHIAVLNVAGPRESSSPGIYDAARAFLRELLAGQQ